MDIKIFLFLVFCLNGNVMANGDTRMINKKWSVDRLMKFLETKPNLYETRNLSEKEMNFYKHRLGGMVPEDEKDENTVSRLFLGNKMQKHYNVHEVPEEFEDVFDSRDHWYNCKDVIGDIQDQGRCGNCWAIASASVMSDRACIANEGRFKPKISSFDLTRCCLLCHGGAFGDGCDGGFPLKAFRHFATQGIVTNGEYRRNQPGCVAPSFDSKASDKDHKSGKCVYECDQPSMNYKSKLHFGVNEPVQYIRVKKPNGKIDALESAKAIKREIYTNGPVTATIRIHSKFEKYAHGKNLHQKELTEDVYYVDKNDKSEGLHTVRIIGWGQTKKIMLPYWLIANSWGKGWGNGGFFKMPMGVNDGNIEEWVTAGRYDTTRSPVHD